MDLKNVLNEDFDRYCHNFNELKYKHHGTNIFDKIEGHNPMTDFVLEFFDKKEVDYAEWSYFIHLRNTIQKIYPIIAKYDSDNNSLSQSELRLLKKFLKYKINSREFVENPFSFHYVIQLHY